VCKSGHIFLPFFLNFDTGQRPVVSLDGSAALNPFKGLYFVSRNVGGPQRRDEPLALAGNPTTTR